jgi:long-chain fatty acid transport protein
MKKISLRAIAVAVAALAAGQAWATNGMLMEGYGPIALSMGGAAQAYDNGTAGMINNVATLQLGENGTRADVALGVLGPNVTAMGEKSGGTSYIMPAVGWTRKTDQLTYGIGVMGQGGMGTEYANAGAQSLSMGTGAVRSELAVGRVIVPVSYKINSQLNVGASLDFTWSSLDMRMATDVAGMNAMSPVATAGTANVDFPQMMSGMQNTPPPYVRIDFSDSNDFTGAAKSTGFTGKFGLTYQMDPSLTVGASYQLKTALADMKTSTSGAALDMGGGAMLGQMIVRDFQMPSVLAAGLAFQANPKLKLVADVKRIDWSSVMESFKMTFVSSQGLGTMSFTMPQNWKDQTVVSLGGAYQMNDALVLRAGYSHSTNPVPDATVHPLFPAIVKDHYTAGFGYQIDKNMTVNAAVSHAPKVSVVNNSGANPVAITHSQTNYQLMLSYRY